MTGADGRSIRQIVEGVRSGTHPAERIVQESLAAIEARDKQLHSFITVSADTALAAAREIDQRVQDGQAVGSLAGVPVAVKDSVPTQGVRTTGNSRLFTDWVPTTDAVAMRRLRDADAVLIGKTNLNELGWSLPSENDLAPPPRNPWNLEHRAVGSSSGSGAAVAAGLCPVALGTDGGGSTRLPAGQMGLAGLKPTRGVPPYDSIDGGSLLSNIGVLARDVDDVHSVFNELAGGRAQPASADEDLLGAELPVGVPADVLKVTQLEPAVRESFEAARRTLEDAGRKVIELPDVGFDLARAAAFITLKGERAATAELLLRADRSKIGSSARTYAAAALDVTTADHTRALRVGDWFRDRVDEQLQSVAALLSPTSPVVTSSAARGPGHSRGFNAVYTAPFNLTGHPALSVPAGRCPDSGLPIGVQLAAGFGQERQLLDLARLLRPLSPWTTMP